jgi:hypothetical protein
MERKQSVSFIFFQSVNRYVDGNLKKKRKAVVQMCDIRSPAD